MQNQIIELQIKVKQLKLLIQDLEKKIFGYRKNTGKNWISKLEAFRGDVDAVMETVDAIFYANKKLTEKEASTYEEGSLKKIQKFEKKKKRMSNSIDGMREIIENLEFNLKRMISQVQF